MQSNPNIFYTTVFVEQSLLYKIGIRVLSIPASYTYHDHFVRVMPEKVFHSLDITVGKSFDPDTVSFLL